MAQEMQDGLIFLTIVLDSGTRLTYPVTKWNYTKNDVETNLSASLEMNESILNYYQKNPLAPRPDSINTIDFNKVVAVEATNTIIVDKDGNFSTVGIDEARELLYNSSINDGGTDV
jgi:hypothetical protein